MSLPRYVIHIGPYKTGSTYLQAAFKNLRQELQRRGTLYPEFWWHSLAYSSQSRLAEQVAGGNREALSEQFKALNDSGHRRILISAEALAGLKPDRIAMLKSLLDGAPAEIVFYCRRWSELIPSGWQELVKAGRTLTLPEFYGQHIRNPRQSLLMNYARVLDRYTEAFGINSIRLVSYSLLRDRGLDLVTHFAQSFLEWSDPPISGLPTNPNTSLITTDIEIIRAFNVIHLARTGQQASRMRQAYLRSKPGLDIARPVAAMERHISKLRFNEAMPTLRDLHEDLAVKYGSRLVKPAPGRRLFPPRVGEIGFVHPNYLLELGVTERLGEIYEAICRSAAGSTTSASVERAIRSPGPITRAVG